MDQLKLKQASMKEDQVKVRDQNLEQLKTLQNHKAGWHQTEAEEWRKILGDLLVEVDQALDRQNARLEQQITPALI